MSYYTVVPIVRSNDGSQYIDNFCLGKWQLLVDGNWLQLQPENTRVRDANNKKWIEVCDGHVVENLSEDDPMLGCKCYSKSYSEPLTRAIQSSVLKSISTIDYLLYGTVLDVLDTEQFLYILYYVAANGKYSIRLYVIAKESTLIDSIVIDSMPDAPSAAWLLLDGNTLKAALDSRVYSITENYVISVQFSQELPLYQRIIGNNVLTLVGNAFAYNDTPLLTIDSHSTSFITFESVPCIVTYYDNVVLIRDYTGSILGESLSDANAVYLYNLNESIVSIECYNTFFNIKGVE
jgi:hypothetical protein